MSKDAFIGELRHRMAGLPQDAVERTVEYYSELIADSMEDGLTEAEAVERLGSLDEIVASVVKETPLTQIVQTRVQEKKAKGVSAWVIVLLILGAPVWLPLLIAVLAVVLRDQPHRHWPLGEIPADQPAVASPYRRRRDLQVFHLLFDAGDLAIKVVVIEFCIPIADLAGIQTKFDQFLKEVLVIPFVYPDDRADFQCHNGVSSWI